MGESFLLCHCILTAALLCCQKTGIRCWLSKICQQAYSKGSGTLDRLPLSISSHTYIENGLVPAQLAEFRSIYLRLYCLAFFYWIRLFLCVRNYTASAVEHHTIQYLHRHVARVSKCKKCICSSLYNDSTKILQLDDWFYHFFLSPLFLLNFFFFARYPFLFPLPFAFFSLFYWKC